MDQFADLADAVAGELGVREAVLDGEVIAADETGRPQFYELLRRTRTPAYVAFDILWLDGADLRPMALSERRRVLQSILPEGSPIVSEPVSVTARGCELFELVCEHSVACRSSRVPWRRLGRARKRLFSGAGATPNR